MPKGDGSGHDLKNENLLLEKVVVGANFAQSQYLEAAASYQRAGGFFDCLPLHVCTRDVCCSSAQAWLKLDCDEAASNKAKEMVEKALLCEPTSVKS